MVPIVVSYGNLQIAVGQPVTADSGASPGISFVLNVVEVNVAAVCAALAQNIRIICEICREIGHQAQIRPAVYIHLVFDSFINAACVFRDRGENHVGILLRGYIQWKLFGSRVGFPVDVDVGTFFDNRIAGDLLRVTQNLIAEVAECGQSCHFFCQRQDQTAQIKAIYGCAGLDNR